jgi:hypothetical protein
MEQVARLITDRGHADPAGVTFCLDGYQVVVTDSEVVIRPPPDE